MKNWIYYVGLSIELAILVAFLSSCMKQPDFKQNFGPEVAATAVDSAIKGVESPSPFSIKQGEFSYLERSTKLENQQPVVVLQRGDSVTSKTEDAEKYMFTIVSDLVELINGQMKPSRKETQATLAKHVAAVATQSIQWQKIRTRDVTSSQKVTYHNLKREEGFVSVPPLVQRRADCGGLADKSCTAPLAATRLSFDKVEWDGDAGNKISYLFIFSKDVPFFSNQVLGCADTTVPYEGQRIHVTQCEEIKDFAFGHD